MDSPRLRQLNDLLRVFYHPIQWIDFELLNGPGVAGYPLERLAMPPVFGSSGSDSEQE
jgi:hypothetical protein